MNIAVRPGPLRGRVEIPASKSVAHRAMESCHYTEA